MNALDKPSLRRTLRPRSIAVIGASNDPNRIGGRPLRYLKEYGFQGAMYAVNPKYQELMGVPCFPDVASLPTGIDLGVMMVAGSQVLDTVEACGRRGMGGLVVMAAGFAEEGAEGRARQQELARLTRQYGMRLIGPNTGGFRDQNNGVYATFGTDLDSGRRVGRVAVIGQSGGLGAYFGCAQIREHGIGVGYTIDTGNEADVDTAECVRFLVEQEDCDISVMALLIEGCEDGRRLLEALLMCREKNIPVVVLKIGTSAAGIQSVALHTGVLTGEDRVWDAALQAVGAIRAKDESELVDLLRMLDMPKRPAGNGVGMITVSGGVATLTLDAAEKTGLRMPPQTEGAAEIKARFPLMHVGNPLDASGQMANTPDALDPLLRFMLDGADVDVVVVWIAYSLCSPVLGPPMAKSIITAAQTSSKPVIVLGMATPEARDALRAAGVALMEFPTRAMRGIAAALKLREPTLLTRPLTAWKPSVHQQGVLRTGIAAQQRLAGIPFAPTIEVGNVDAALAQAQKFGFPVVLKVEGEGLAHKTEMGLVQVGLRDEVSVRAAHAALRENIERHGILGSIYCQPMVSGVEIFAGMTADPVFGPVVTVGIGGIHVESIGDAVTLLAPVKADDVLTALRGLRLFATLNGARGQAPVDVRALAEIVAQLSRLAIEHNDLLEVDVNPIILPPGANAGAFAVDAVVRVA